MQHYPSSETAHTFILSKLGQSQTLFIDHKSINQVNTILWPLDGTDDPASNPTRPMRDPARNPVRRGRDPVNSGRPVRHSASTVTSEEYGLCT